MSDLLRVAVLGAGIMGSNHARIIRQLPGVELVAIVDQDLARAQAVAGAGTAAVHANVDELIEEIDAAVVAVPTEHHVQCAIALAGRGIHLLVEKPLALTVEDARRIVETADENGVVLAVGHVERFNAAVVELHRLVNRPLHIDASRLSPYSPRISDGVIFDLMIHDIDIVCSLAGPDAVPVEVSGMARSIRGASEDIATMMMRFSTGLTATFNTSRLAQQKIRRIEITQEDSTLTADLVRQDITVHRMTHHEYLSDEGARYRQSSVLEIPFLESRGEPLALELAHFVDCVRDGSTPRVDGAAGIRAIELALWATNAVRG